MRRFTERLRFPPPVESATLSCRHLLSEAVMPTDGSSRSGTPTIHSPGNTPSRGHLALLPCEGAERPQWRMHARCRAFLHNPMNASIFVEKHDNYQYPIILAHIMHALFWHTSSANNSVSAEVSHHAVDAMPHYSGREGSSLQSNAMPIRTGSPSSVVPSSERAHVCLVGISRNGDELDELLDL
jgi:hypothetical protein